MKGPLRKATSNSGHLFIVLGALLAIALTPPRAEAQWGGEARAQIGFGGDELITVTYDDDSESTLYLGKYISINIGPSFQAWSSGPASLELQALAGWAGWSTGPQNTKDRLRINRIPIDLLAFYGYRIPDTKAMLRIGGGAGYHIATKIRGSGSVKDFKVDFDNSLGFTGEFSIISGTFTAGVRYTSMESTVKGATIPMDASSLGLFVGITSPRI
jgi:hypothetical protein